MVDHNNNEHRRFVAGGYLTTSCQGLAVPSTELQTCIVNILKIGTLFCVLKCRILRLKDDMCPCFRKLSIPMFCMF